MRDARGLTTKEVATLLGVSRRAIKRALASGEIRSRVDAGLRRLWTDEAIDELRGRLSGIGIAASSPTGGSAASNDDRPAGDGSQD